MNNRFIPIISVFMTISLVIFVSLQLYWLKEYYTALDQEFENKVFTALESSSKKIEELEINRYKNKFKNFDKSIVENANNPTLFQIQQVEDSLSKTTVTFGKTIIEKQNIPLSGQGDSLTKIKLYKDEGLYSIKKSDNSPKIISSVQSQDISSGQFTLTEFAKFNASNLPVNKRVTPKTLDSVLMRELRANGIDSKFGYGILDRNSKLTQLTNKTFLEQKDKRNYNFPLFTDNKDQTLYTLSLVFPRKDASLIKNNLPMLLGTFMSLLTILGIYIISINYMMRQKKISEIKTDFINNMSHEFKTPLATISVATDALVNDKISSNPEKVKYYSQLIKQENFRMKKQVENVLNMSKLERNEMKLFLKETNMKELIKRISESFRLIVEERKGTLTEEFNAQSFHIKVDEFHIYNALINLLDNANKYSENIPEIKISTRTEDSWFVIEISDKGMGMEQHNKLKIFEKFFREETGNIHNVKGQGLGLSYVKKIIELHRGQILVVSEKGKGSTFTLKLPLKS